MRILVIEDEKRIANSIKKGLEQESYAVDISYNGEDGYGKARTENYDVILLDIMLPGADGITVCKKLREDKVKTPILMLTAKGETRDKVEGLDTGADDYLAKPFDFAELLARIRALTRRPPQNLGQSLQVKDLKLDTVKKTVTRGKKNIRLSKREFALLEFLMRNPDKTLSKYEIIENAWNFDADILPNTVEVYIGYLRKKIDRKFPKNHNLIHTIRGFGYKIGDSE